MMLDAVCGEIQNWFSSDEKKYSGSFTVTGGSIQSLDFLKSGQYFRVIGSTFNDGVWQYPSSGMTDEHFTGSVWAMAVPPAVIALSESIEAWAEKNQESVDSPYNSESFGGYSYTKQVSGSNNRAANWQSIFADRLKPWRKLK